MLAAWRQESQEKKEIRTKVINEINQFPCEITYVNNFGNRTVKVQRIYVFICWIYSL